MCKNSLQFVIFKGNKGVVEFRFGRFVPGLLQGRQVLS